MARSSKYLKFKKRKKQGGDQKIVKDAFVKGVGLRNVALRKAAIPLPSFFSLTTELRIIMSNVNEGFTVNVFQRQNLERKKEQLITD